MSGVRVRAVAAALLAVAGAASAAAPPRQPMPFSHRVHAGEQRIGCTSCHAYADRSPVAGIPSVERCRGCHKFVKSNPDNPRTTEELKPLLALFREDPPATIPWVRVYRLPDHVRFTHAGHVRGGVACRECHGEVERMDQVRQVASLEMGWCLSCHRRKQAERAGRERLTDCVTCHR